MLSWQEAENQQFGGDNFETLFVHGYLYTSGCLALYSSV